MNAIYDDGSVRSFSIASSNDPVVYMIPDSDGTEIPSLPGGFCKSPLLHSCFRAQNKNDTEFYSSAVNARDAFVLERVLEHGNEISLRKSAVSFRCNPNDFVISSGNLLVACRPIGSNDDCTYLYNDQCHNFPPSNIENLVTDPVAFTAVPATNSADNSGGGRIVSVVRSTARGLKLIVFSTGHRLRPYDIPDDCQAPLKLSRQESTILLACANATQYMINITELPAKFFHIDSAAHGSLLALSDKGYALFSSPLQLTLQNITSKYAVTVSINSRQGSVIYADFTSDGKYAFVVTNVTVIFIHVAEALAGSHNDHSQNFYFFPIQICFICPSVQFLNTTTAVISARDGDGYFTTLLFLSLSQWPPYVFLNKTLHGFPKQYWYIAAGSSAEIVLPTTTDMMTSVSSTSATVVSEETKPTSTSASRSDADDPDNGIIIAILLPIIGVVGCLGLIFVLIAVALYIFKKMQETNTDSGAGARPNVEAEQEQNKPDRYTANTSIYIGNDDTSARYRYNKPLCYNSYLHNYHNLFYRKPTQETTIKGGAKMVSATSMHVINPGCENGEKDLHYPTPAEPDSTSSPI